MVNHNPNGSPISAVTALAGAGLPMPVGLQAAASELPRTAAFRLRRLAMMLEKGISLDAALEDTKLKVPAHWASLIRSGVASGDLGCMLACIVEQESQKKTMRYELMWGLSYPVLLLLGTLACAAVSFAVVLPELHAMAADLHSGEDQVVASLPAAAQLIIAAGRQFSEVAIVLAISIPVIVLITRLLIGRARFSWFVTTLPVYGPLAHWTATREWLGLLRQLVSRGVPLPESLRLAASAVSNANIAVASSNMAASVEQGRTLAQVIQTSIRLPALIEPYIRWGESQGALERALSMANESLAERIQTRYNWLRIVLPPALFVIIAIVVGSIVTAFVASLMSLLQWLS